MPDEWCQHQQNVDVEEISKFFCLDSSLEDVWHVISSIHYLKLQSEHEHECTNTCGLHSISAFENVNDAREYD